MGTGFMCDASEGHVNFSDEDLLRYGRMMIMEDVGEEGMARIRKGKVLLVGVGGLGAPASMYLVAGGIGELHIIDPDTIESSNLTRQILYSEKDLKESKVDVAYRQLSKLNQSCKIVPYREAIDPQNVYQKVQDVDIVVDGCDQIETKLLLADTCSALGKPLVFGAVQGAYGEACLFWPQDKHQQPSAIGQNSCLRCMVGDAQTYQAYGAKCHTVGVWGPVVGLMGAYQALQVLQWFVAPMQAKRGVLYLFDGKEGKSETIEIPRNSTCCCQHAGYSHKKS